ncbi:MAG: hypothetical protein OXK80_02310 [Bdellovibrionales bacterium]|nr:hypothetical protein [Bdellovibrionales bacterium]
MAVQKTYSSEREIAEIWKLFRETDRKMQEMSEKTDLKINKLSGEFDRKWGRLIEALVEGNLIKLFNERNIPVGETSERVRGLKNAKDKNGKIYEGRCELDVVAKNGQEIVAVEVKTSLSSKDVDNFLYKLKHLTCFFPSYKGNKIYGAMAYLTINQSADVYARKQGLFTIKVVGESATITNNKHFKPQIF